MSRKQRSYTYEEYHRAMKMIKKLGITETSRRTGFPKMTLYHWKKGKYKPLLARWIPKPSNELAYVIGVLHGDGCVYINGCQYKIQLGVKDLEFAEAFSIAMAKLFGKNVKEPHWNKLNNEWEVKYYSKAFYQWYKQQSLESLRQFIEHDKDTVANFLRGLYDSEGCNYRCSQIHLSSNDKDLLKYVQYLLKKYFNIHTTGPYLAKRAGEVSTRRDGKRIKRNHDNYQIHIYKRQHIQIFLDNIGFDIREKQLGLPRRK